MQAASEATGGLWKRSMSSNGRPTADMMMINLVRLKINSRKILEVKYVH